jgi:hypothetical protein
MSEQPVEPVADMPEEIPAEELPLDEDKAAAGDARPPGPAMLKETWKQVETIGQAVGVALQGRGNVVMVRVNDDALRHLDMLVDAEITKSRSESAALLINEGIKANQALYGKITQITDQIAELRQQLRESVKPDIE